MTQRRIFEDTFKDLSDSCNALSFKDFMEVSLFDRDVGYYGSRNVPIGRKGDFYTSVSVGRCFGQLLALQAEEVWRRLDCPIEFRILEQGGHDATLGGDVLDAIASHSDEFANCVRYTVCDVSLREQAPADSRIEVCAELSEVAPGSVEFFFGNELLDAFPVHLIRLRNSGWQELWVTKIGNAFEFIERPISEDVAQAIEERLPDQDSLCEGYTTEICLEIAPWIDEAKRKLSTGMLLVIDYGFFAEDYYAPSRTEGTLRTFREHRCGNDPLVQPGEQDLTAHVDWSALEAVGENVGLRCIGYSDQGTWLTRMAEPLFVQWEKEQRPERFDRKWMRQFQTLTHPGMMGRVFGLMGFVTTDLFGTAWSGFANRIDSI